MVRLKAYNFPKYDWVAVLYFNSKMVRLKASRLESKTFDIKTFQFQNGTIKSKQAVLFAPLLSYFNSKMVRLKGLYHASRLLLHSISIPKWYD